MTNCTTYKYSTTHINLYVAHVYSPCECVILHPPPQHAGPGRHLVLRHMWEGPSQTLSAHPTSQGASATFPGQPVPQATLWPHC